jgi:hypothetical protein
MAYIRNHQVLTIFWLTSSKLVKQERGGPTGAPRGTRTMNSCDGLRATNHKVVTLILTVSERSRWARCNRHCELPHTLPWVELRRNSVPFASINPERCFIVATRPPQRNPEGPPVLQLLQRFSIRASQIAQDASMSSALRQTYPLPPECDTRRRKRRAEYRSPATRL